ncbi:MAG: hypothetical protein IKD86_02415 [Firmicutes bacterium]|nr:hypothetical protein [Bacillota bacterium]
MRRKYQKPDCVRSRIKEVQALIAALSRTEAGRPGGSKGKYALFKGFFEDHNFQKK